MWEGVINLLLYCDLQQYVVRDSGKEKPTYILVPKREERMRREKVNAGTSGGTLGTMVPNQEIVIYYTFLFRLFLSTVYMLLDIT
jgi:hypothetical protein